VMLSIEGVRRWSWVMKELSSMAMMTGSLGDTRVAHAIVEGHHDEDMASEHLLGFRDGKVRGCA
jgi:hypothetical protein